MDASFSLNRIMSACSFPSPGTAVYCAVSGGTDSLALLLLAHEHGLVVTAHHVNHQLRPDSALDVNVVNAVAEPRGITVVVHTITVDDGPNLEARARDARYAVLPAGCMTGHTADDQAETVLINALRGASSSGLSAMRPGPTRPLLALRRADTIAVCQAFGVEPVQDSTNTNPRFVRNRVRHELLPLMADISHRDPTPLLARTADLLRADNDLLDQLAEAIDPTDAKAVANAPTPLAYRALRRWLSDPYPPDLASLERVLSVARGEVLACDIGENRQIRRSKQRLTLHNLG
jgi:tRNA(Ile)-lysidine synthase